MLEKKLIEKDREIEMIKENLIIEEIGYPKVWDETLTEENRSKNLAA
jgi:hypothetical protein